MRPERNSAHVCEKSELHETQGATFWGVGLEE